MIFHTVFQASEVAAGYDLCVYNSTRLVILFGVLGSNPFLFIWKNPQNTENWENVDNFSDEPYKVVKMAK